MPLWNKTLWLALGSFLAAIVLLIVAATAYQSDRVEDADWTVPVPPPGRMAKIEFRPANNWRRYQLQMEVSVDPITSVDMPEFPPPPCDFGVVMRKDGKIESEQRLRFHMIGTQDYVPAALFGTEVFELAPGERDVEVTNLGCDQGYGFIGGTLGMRRVGPVMFSLGVFPLLGAALLALIGLISTLVAAIGIRRSRLVPA
jgi:hypothetical protein